MICLLLALAASAPCAEAKNYALLVGISNYRLEGISRLEAPANDLRLVWDALRSRNFGRDDIVLLTDRLAAGADAPGRMQEPSAQNILA
ncbi:MAG: hypothetical protein ABMA01_24135, partial [Chthoniobacteraceae bacterium]